MFNLSRKIIVVVLVASIAGAFLVVAAISFSNTITPKGIVIHHSAIPYENGTIVEADLIEEIHKQRGFRIFYWGKFYHIGYHYVILPDGTIQEGRPEKLRGAHTQNYNDFIGVCLIGDFSRNESITQKPSSEQITALTEITKKLQIKHNLIASDVHLHNQLNTETKCPGEGFPVESFYISISANNKKQ